MVSILRSFSQRFQKKRPPKMEEMDRPHAIVQSKSEQQINSRKQFLCKIILLDGTDLNIALSRKAVGQEAYDKVFNHLDLDESDYFGLQYTDHYNVQHWLDPWKKIRKQISVGRVCTFRFQVKFFSSEPSNLRSEFTRYQFFLQLKNDLRTGKLRCPRDAIIPLAALQLQSEIGDFHPEQHNAAFVSEFRFHPEQDEEMEIRVVNEWRGLQAKSPAEAEQSYLDHAKRLEFYGVELYDVLAKDGNRYKLGLTPSGVIVLDNNALIGLLFWHFMPQFSFHNKHITIVLEEHANDEIQQHTFVFELASQKASKHVWKRAVEYHTFYRMKRHRPHRKAADQILRFRSTFEHRGRTEFENVNNPIIRRDQRSISFTRKPSQRYGPRQSHLQRQKEERERQMREARQKQLELANQREDAFHNAHLNNNNIINNNSMQAESTGRFSESSGSTALPEAASRRSSDASAAAPQPSVVEGAASPPHVLGTVQLNGGGGPRAPAKPSARPAGQLVSQVQVRDENDAKLGESGLLLPRPTPGACSRIPRYGKAEPMLYEEPFDALPPQPILHKARSRSPKENRPRRPKSMNGYPRLRSTQINGTVFGVTPNFRLNHHNRPVVMTQL